MIRVTLGDLAYWDGTVAFSEKTISRVKDALKRPSGNPSYRPQFVFGLVKDYYHLILQRYSRGDCGFRCN
ncbi:PoNe immunity protein domain-containing protein [Dyella flava]|uniref:DUF1910 domain-containing protein n=1 Tax=Dyella flava TaxID=1920170 RepID=A0ABS2JZY1_9GAMM|nr:DUF1910 domain-containing protein [Dyella flava]GLQ52727.1 hypothetical protein GCM10010872_41780 [Dyella flava]